MDRLVGIKEYKKMQEPINTAKELIDLVEKYIDESCLRDIGESFSSCINCEAIYSL